MQDHANVTAKINPKTKLIWVETPTNPMMNVVDIEAIHKLEQIKTFYLQLTTPLPRLIYNNPNLGADIVMHSATKYLGGHSDVILGALVVRDEELAKRLSFIQNASGAVCGPLDSFLVLRGIKTLHVRMQRHCENCEKVAYFLADHPKVAKVYWPGFPAHPNHEVAKRQMKAFGGMISFILKDDSIEKASQTVGQLQLFTLAESLGGVESLAGHPASMTHASIPKTEREKSGVVDGLIRLSVGIEDIDDLIEDLKQALG